MLTGNSVEDENERFDPAVYPRAYGEQFTSASQITIAPGLSPCLRGTATQAFFASLPDRFIPVLTGNSVQLVHLSSWTPVYPRAYGEQVK